MTHRATHEWVATSGETSARAASVCVIVWMLACLAVALATAACTRPELAEDIATACTNTFDDDGDGAIDCDDTECAPLSVCEVSAEACGNGSDDDDDGFTDCEESGCLALPEGPCMTREAECNVHTGAGCLRGMSCDIGVVDSSVHHYCRVPGSGAEGTACTSPSSTEPSPCLRSFTCGVGVCARFCERDSECGPDGICTGDDTFGLCATPCLPRAPSCGPELACRSLAEAFLYTFDDHGALHFCTAQPRVANGSAGAGDSCTLEPTAGFAETNCNAGLVCVPELPGVASPLGGRCRETCVLAGDTTTIACPAGLRCERPYPVRGVPLLPMQSVLGVCR